MIRTETSTIHCGSVDIGGAAPVAVQSMCNTKTQDVEATARQMQRLRDAGCDIIRVAVPDMDAARAIAELKKRTDMPIVADIHFDYRLALEAVESGADKIRINPGNIGSAERVRAVAQACSARGVPIRIGINTGSVERRLLEKYGSPCAEALVESAEYHAELLEKCGFSDICLSLKASSVTLTVEANRLAARRFAYPLHLGVTEAGDAFDGVINSAVGIGTLLCEGIGSTIRVSLTDDPVEEVKAGIAILKAAGLRRQGVRIVSCPTCGRTSIDLISTAREVKRRLAHLDRDITVAVMGCEVNGPGEAREADFGLAGGKGRGVIFAKGRIVARVDEAHLADALVELVENASN